MEPKGALVLWKLNFCAQNHLVKVGTLNWCIKHTVYIHKGTVQRHLCLIEGISLPIFGQTRHQGTMVCLLFLLIRSSVQPKPGFGIRNRNQGPISVSVSEPKLFFFETKIFFSEFFKFCHVLPFLGGIWVFKSLKLNSSSKTI